MEVKTLAQNKLSLCPNTLLPFVLVGALVLLYFPTFSSLYDRWTQWDEALAHGLPVIAVFFYLLYKSGPWPIAKVSPVVSALSCTLIVFASLSWLVFQAIQITLLTQLILLPLFVLALLPIFGFRTLFKQRYLLLLLVFVLPVWDYLNDPLLQLSSAVVGDMVRMIRMPALIEGSSIYIPYGHIMIADGCSGLRYFVIALALGYLISYLNGYKERGLLVVLSIAAILGLLANWIRIFLLIWIGYQTEMESSLMDDHEMFGWVLFSLMVLPAIYFAPVVRPEPSPVSDSAQPAELPVGRLIAVVFALAVGPLVALAVDLEPGEASAFSVQHSALNVEPMVESLPVHITAPARGERRAYRLSSQGVPVFTQVNQYQRETQDDKLVPYIHRLYDAEHWSVAESRTLSLNGHNVNLQIFRQKGGLRQVAQLQWFNTGGYASTSVAAAKLLQIPAILFGDNHFAIVTLQAECRLGDCEQAIELLNSTVQQLTIKQG